ncbi:unnamed protein product [Didymodactylos carnosus]|uniref:Integrase catalytic domain-containing protein n=1 Tax=Didymodactylos carnosus TaxID=1234261 RepID=A0A814FL66_9BILA|nr:unnamed protein product [Didymodactylos carnosus]CAF3755864.1 unnamed protein product [Didymodactylos carnosus]
MSAVASSSVTTLSSTDTSSLLCAPGITDGSEKGFFDDVEKYVASLQEKYREKTFIRKETYDKILKSLLLEKGTSSESIPTKLVFWARKNFIIEKIAGTDIVCCSKNKKPLCIYESFFNVMKECHLNVSHGGRTKTLNEINSHYSWVPRAVVEIFLRHCLPCQLRKPLKQSVVSKPIISLGVMTRLQIDLIDMRTRPDVVSAGVVYCWILHCIDHFSKFTWAYPLENKSAKEVVVKLRQLFFTFGPPRLLHSDNGSEFAANVILELKTVFPNLCFIRGRPHHPQSQGCIERANGVLSLSLGKWLQTNNTTHWPEGLSPVVYGINTRTSDTTRATPYEIMFGQHSRGDSEFWKIVKDQDIVDEEHLRQLII